MKSEAKELRKEIENIVRPMPEFNGHKLSVEVEVHENWLCKNGSIKKKDILNREKFMIDSIFGALQVDDKYIFDHRMIKVQDLEKEFCVIKIEVLDGAV